MKNYKFITIIISIIGLTIAIILLIIKSQVKSVVIENPAPETRTIIEYKTVEIPIESSPVYITEYVEVEKHKENRYSQIPITDDDIKLMAQLVYHEARGECFAGQRMVAEVVLNRVLSDLCPSNTIYDVIYQHHYLEDGTMVWQFSPAPILSTTIPTEIQYEAVKAAIYETPITDEDVIFFMQTAYNNNVFCKIGGHVFCKGQ